MNGELEVVDKEIGLTRGMVEACTGVILPNPMAAMASKIHSARGGVRASQALGSVFLSISGAMADKLFLLLKVLAKILYYPYRYRLAVQGI
jgi:hypothetical protein